MKFLEKQQLIILILTGAAVAGFVALRYYPLARQTQTVRQTGTDQSNVIAVAHHQSRLLPAIRAQVSQLKAVADTYDTKIPPDRDFAGLWQQIAEVMNEHNLTDQLVQPETEIRGDPLNCIPISIECSGSLDQIFGFFKSMDRFERLIRIEQVNMLNDKDFTGLLKLDIKANVYYQNSTQAKGA